MLKTALAALLALVLASGSAFAIGSSPSPSPSPAPSPASSGPSKYDQAVEMIEAQNFNGAIPLLEEVTQTQPNNADAWNYLGFAYRNVERYDESFAAYNQALLINPPGANLCFRFAARDVRMGNFWVRAGDVVVPSPAAAHQDLLSGGHSNIRDSVISTRAHLGWGAGPHQCPSDARDVASMIVTTAVGRFFEHFDRAELAVPQEQLRWRSGPMVRGLQQLPVRYELSRNSTARQPTPVSAERSETLPAPSDGPPRGLFSALRRLMPGGR